MIVPKEKNGGVETRKIVVGHEDVRAGNGQCSPARLVGATSVEDIIDDLAVVRRDEDEMLVVVRKGVAFVPYAQ